MPQNKRHFKEVINEGEDIDGDEVAEHKGSQSLSMIITGTITHFHL